MLGSRGVLRAGFANRPSWSPTISTTSSARSPCTPRPILEFPIARLRLATVNLPVRFPASPTLQGTPPVAQPILSVGIHGACRPHGHAPGAAHRGLILSSSWSLRSIGRGIRSLAKMPAALAGAFPRSGSPLSSSLPTDRKIDVLIDFSLPEGSLAIARRCAEHGIPLVVGTTGFDARRARPARSSRRSHSDPDRSQHEPGRQSLDATGARGRPGARRVQPTSPSSSAITAPRKTLPAAPRCDLADFARQGLSSAARPERAAFDSLRDQHALAARRRLAR